MPEAGAVAEQGTEVGWHGSRLLNWDGLRLAERCALIACLSLLPLAVYVWADVHLGDKGPYWLAENSDPEYAYLLNSLNLLQGRAPEHVDHPGTTLQVLGATVIGASALGLGPSDLTDLVLQDPEQYLSAVNRAIRLLVLASQVALGTLCVVLTRSLLASLLIQFPLICSASAVEALGRVAPEPLILLAATVLSGVVLLMTTQPAVLTESRWSVMLGLVCAFGIATKLTFLPVLALPLVLLTGLKPRIVFLAATAICTLLFTVPIIPRYPMFLTWTTNLLVRSGHYGTGEANFVSGFWNNLYAVLWYQPSLSVLLGMLLVVFAVAHRQFTGEECSGSKMRWLRLAAGLLLAHALQLFAVAKHPGSAAYLMPSIGLSSLTLVLMIMLWKELSLPFPWRPLGYGLLLLTVSSAVVGQAQRWMIMGEEYRDRRTEAANLEYVRQSLFSDCATVFYYRASSKIYAEYFGAGFSGGQLYGPRIAGLAGPGIFFYQVWSKRLFTSGGLLVDAERIAADESTGCVVFQGTRFEGDYARFRPPVTFTDECGGTREVLYVIGRTCHGPQLSRKA